MNWWMVPLYTVVCMAAGVLLWEFFPRRPPRHSHPTDAEKKRALRAGEKGMTVDEYRRMARAVNVPLLWEIGRQAKTKDGKPYARGWAYFKKRELEEQMAENAKELVV